MEEVKSVCLNTAELCQLHQFFVWCSVEPRLGVEAINDMQSSKETCRLAIEGAPAAPSATQQQVRKTLVTWGCRWRTRYAITLPKVRILHRHYRRQRPGDRRRQEQRAGMGSGG